MSWRRSRDRAPPAEVGGIGAALTEGWDDKTAEYAWQTPRWGTMADEYWHVWFSLKRRAPALEEELACEVLALMKEVAREAGVRLLAAQAAVDHLHLVLDLPGGTTLPRAMQRLKGTTARRLFLRYPELRVDLGQRSLWQKSHGRRRVPFAEVAGVTSCIETQSSRPIRHVYQHSSEPHVMNPTLDSRCSDAADFSRRSSSAHGSRRRTSSQ